MLEDIACREDMKITKIDCVACTCKGCRLRRLNNGMKGDREALAGKTSLTDEEVDQPQQR